MTEGDLIPKKGALEMDFSEAPIFKMYGPSPSMGSVTKWGNATIPSRGPRRRLAKDEHPRLVEHLNKVRKDYRG